MFISNRILLMVTMVLCALLAVSSAPYAAESTTFYVVRHAERADDVQSDRLTVVGMRRAEELARVLSADPLSAVYSTKTRRTWQTATPSALASAVEIVPYGQGFPNGLKEWAAALKDKHAGESVLIVGHSNTVGDIIRALGGQGDFPVKGNSDLFVVKINDTGVRVDPRKYPVITPIDPVTFNGEIEEPKDISAIAATSNQRFLVIGSDETRQIQVLEQGAGAYNVQHSILIPPGHDEDADEDDEIDIEGITRYGNNDTFFVVGSHSRKRKNILKKKYQDEPYRDNKKKFEKDPKREKSRERLIRLQLNPETGKLVPESLKDVKLRDLLDENKVLKLFRKIPGKENGINIEGVASDSKNLFLGFRGPVLRHGFVPVLVFAPAEPESAQLRYVSFQGQGIRDMTAVKDGFLVIAGPVGDAQLPCKLYFWNGRDCLPGVRQDPNTPVGEVELLGTIPPPLGAKPKEKAKAKAEGIVVLKQEDGGKSFEVLIVYDGVKAGAPSRFRVTRP